MTIGNRFFGDEIAECGAEEGIITSIRIYNITGYSFEWCTDMDRRCMMFHPCVVVRAMRVAAAIHCYELKYYLRRLIEDLMA